MLLTACTPHRTPTLDQQSAYAERDALEQAYRAGYAEASRSTHGSHVVTVLALASLPVSLLAIKQSRSVWAAPLAASGLAGGSTLWAYRESRRPIPFPPDSLRALNGLESDALWRRYQFGYQTAIDQRRRRDLERSSRSLGAAVVLALVVAVLLQP